MVLILVGKPASAQQVVFNDMLGTDFLKYHAFQWVQLASQVRLNQIVSQEIIDAVNNTLASKGFTFATGDKADL